MFIRNKTYAFLGPLTKIRYFAHTTRTNSQIAKVMDESFIVLQTGDQGAATKILTDRNVIIEAGLNEWEDFWCIFLASEKEFFAEVTKTEQELTPEPVPEDKCEYVVVCHNTLNDKSTYSEPKTLIEATKFARSQKCNAIPAVRVIILKPYMEIELNVEERLL